MIEELIKSLIAGGYSSLRISEGNQPGHETYQVRVEQRSVRQDGKRVTVDYVVNANTLAEALEQLVAKVQTYTIAEYDPKDLLCYEDTIPKIPVSE